MDIDPTKNIIDSPHCMHLPIYITEVFGPRPRPCALQLYYKRDLQGPSLRVVNHKRRIQSGHPVKSLQNYGDCCWDIYR